MLALLLVGASLADDAPLSIPFEKYTLDNGLEVILSEDHSVPYVQVNVWYKVGSKDEVAGRTGFAHLFEHLMFQGSEHQPGDYFGPLQAIGARINGTTNTDRTNYFEGVPSEYLPLALWLESDRMGWLLPALDQAKLDNQKLVVRNERRQSYENRPYGFVWMWMAEEMYPVGHPYHHTTIGKHEDIDAATLDDVKAFFETWYLPNHASLAICGDFDPAEARSLVQLYFGEIPAGAQPHPVTEASAELTAEKVRTEYSDVPHRKVWLVWHSPALFADGDADLDILSSVLSEGKDSRLYRVMVQEQQIAKDVQAYQSSSVLGSLYIIEATAAEGHTTAELVDTIDGLVSAVRDSGPDAQEVDVAKVNWEARFYESLLTNSGKANQLNSYNLFTGDPDYLQEDLDRYLATTPDSVRAAASRYLDPGRRLQLHVLPMADKPAEATPASEGGE